MEQFSVEKILTMPVEDFQAEVNKSRRILRLDWMLRHIHLWEEWPYCRPKGVYKKGQPFDYAIAIACTNGLINAGLFDDKVTPYTARIDLLVWDARVKLGVFN